MNEENSLEQRVQTIIDFLRLVHPSLDKQDKKFKPAVELRPVPRGIDRGTKGYFALTWSLNIWTIDDDAIARLSKFLKRHEGQQTCLFYSVFAYKNDSKQHINSENALYTEEIALDFDNVSEHEFEVLAKQFDKLGISPLWVASGHGYQAHILLDAPVYDKSALNVFVSLCRNRGFLCDAHCVDAARVMRLPGTTNNKCFADDSLKGEREDPPKSYVARVSSERYSFDELLDKLSGRKRKLREVDGQLSFEMMDTNVAVSDGAALRKIEYPYIADKELPEAIEKMLAFTPKGYRNKALGFLINFFRQNFKLSYTQCYDILSLWSEVACEPPYTKAQFEADFRRFFYNRGLPYDSAMAQRFGVIDFDGYISLRKKNYIYIPNKFFNDFASLDGNLIRTYLAIKMLEHNEEEATQTSIAEVLGVTKRTVITCLQQLSQSGHCYKTEGSRRAGIPNIYHTSHIASAKDGYMSLGFNDVYAFIRELNGAGSTTKTGADLKLYLFFRWKFYSGEVFMSQKKLGENIGLTRTAIVKAVRRLEEQHFIKITKVGPSTMQHCEYTLLR